MRDERRSKILLLELHIEGCQVGWREFCILSLMDFAPQGCWVCTSLLGVSLQNATYVKLNIFLVLGTFCLMLVKMDSL